MIELKHLCKTYSAPDKEIHALEDINLTIRDGEIFGIIGLSGAGKSTLVRCINLLERPSSGQVLVDGKDLTSLPRKELLQVVGLADRADSYPSQLSGGQKQRVAIARALATDPRYILCDEATSALDPNTTRAILDLLRQINRDLGVTIVVITHEMKVIDQICDRVAVIDRSRIAEEGRVSEVFTSPQSQIARDLIIPRDRAALDTKNGRKIRLTFNDAYSREPVISNMVLECQAPVNILFADTKEFEGVIYGHMIIELPADPKQAEKIPLIPFPILIALYSVVRQPLTRMMFVAKDFVTVLQDYFVEKGLYTVTSTRASAYAEIELTKLTHANWDSVVTDLADKLDPNLLNVDFSFLGLNLGDQPKWNFFVDTDWSSPSVWLPALGLFLIPFISAGLSWLSMKVSTKMNPTTGQDPKAQASMNTMNRRKQSRDLPQVHL